MNRIVSDPKILGGKPVIRGTRISVELILSLLASGMDETAILREYPHMKRADVRAAIAYGARIAGGLRTFTPNKVPDALKAR
jgi:uncharacterized protein (DUF433 family)